jgi:glyoxylase-like metal-dependent hydrolase (beta-lactamase superfamily II)
MKKFFKIVALILLLLAGVVAFLFFVYLYPFMKKMKETKVVAVDSNFSILIGGGGNSGIISDDSLIVIIDTKMDEAAQKLFDTVSKISANKKVIIINTHWHPDHIGGNNLYANAKIIAGNYGLENWNKETKNQAAPSIWLKDTLKINLKNDTLLVFNLQRNTHTTNDLIVYSSQRKILFGGDVILNKQAPVLMGDADAEGYFIAFDQLENWKEIQTIVPGHGDIKGFELIDDFRRYFLDMKYASLNQSKKRELVERYKDWNQLPFFMSPYSTIKHFQNNSKK